MCQRSINYGIYETYVSLFVQTFPIFNNPAYMLFELVQISGSMRDGLVEVKQQLIEFVYWYVQFRRELGCQLLTKPFCLCHI